MSDLAGYTLWNDGRRWSLLKVAPDRDHPFRLHWIHHFGSREGPPAAARQETANRAAQCAQLLPDGDVQQIWTSLPSLKPNELRRAVAGMLLREKGGRAADWAYNYRQLPRGPNQRAGSRDVAIVYAAQATVQKHREPAAEWGLQPGVMLPGYLALDQLFRKHGGNLADGVAWNLVCVGQENRFLCVGDADGLLMNRALPEDLSQGAAPREYFERLVTEIERSNFFAQQTERSLRVERIVVCGEAQLAAGLAEHLGQAVDHDVSVWPITDLIAAPDGIDVAELIVPVAAAVAAFEGPELNLLRSTRRIWLGKRARRRLAIAAATCGLALAPTLLVGGLVTNRIQEGQLGRLRALLPEAEERATRAEEIYDAHRLLLARQNTITSIAATEPALAGVLREMAGATPPEIVYRDLQVAPDAGGRYILTLTAESLADTRTAAQQAFLDFTTQLARGERLLLLREPTELHLTGDRNPMTDRARLVFGLEYLVRPGGEP